MSSVLVADLANSQAGIDLHRAKEGCHGVPLVAVIIQTSNNTVWPKLAADAHAQGLMVGSYWWPNYSASPEAEAATFLERYRQSGATLAALDLEGNAGDVTGWAERWCQTVEAAIGHPVLIYSTRDWLAHHAPSFPGSRPFWRAGGPLYNSRDPLPPSPPTDCVLNQYTQNGVLAGVTVDLNIGDSAVVEGLFGGVHNLNSGDDDMFTDDDRKNLAYVKEQLQKIEGDWGPLLAALKGLPATELEVHDIEAHTKPKGQ